MNRQLYAGGGIMTVAPREKFGLGSSLKKFVRKIIPNEISKVATVAAPFVAPFNPLLAAGMAGIGGFDQHGSISKGLKSGLMTYGGGQAARYLGGAGFQEGINPFSGFDGGVGSLFSSPIGTETGLKLGQYKMFGGSPELKTVTGVDSSPIQMATDSAVNVNDALLGNPDYMGGTTSSDLINKAVSGNISNTGSLVNKKVVEQSFFETLKSGNMADIGKATMDLGGKALKAIFTNPITNAAGEVTGTTLDKTAILAALVAVPSYLEAKALADEAGLTDEEFNEDLYNAEKASYMSKYQEALPYESFGLKDGGRIKYAGGSDPRVTQLLEIKRALKEKGEDTSDIDAEIFQITGRVLEAFGTDKNNREGIETIDIGMEMEEKPENDKLALGMDTIRDYALGMNDGQGPITRKDYIDIYIFMGHDTGTATSLGTNAYKEGVSNVEGLKDGGRIKRKFGSPEKGEGIETIDIEMEKEEVPENELMAGITFSSAEKSYLFRRLAGNQGSDRSYTMPKLYRILNNPGSYPDDAAILKQIAIMGLNKKDGGRIGFNEGTNLDEILKEDMTISESRNDPKNMTTKEIVSIIQSGRSTPEMFEELMLRGYSGVDSLILEEIGGKKLDKPETAYTFRSDGKTGVLEDFLFKLRESNPDIYGKYKRPIDNYPTEGPSTQVKFLDNTTMKANGGRIGFESGTSWITKKSDSTGIEDLMIDGENDLTEWIKRKTIIDKEPASNWIQKKIKTVEDSDKEPTSWIKKKEEPETWITKKSQHNKLIEKLDSFYQDSEASGGRLFQDLQTTHGILLRDLQNGTNKSGLNTDKIKAEDPVEMTATILLGTFSTGGKSIEEKAKGGIMGMEVPVRKNQGGVSELDYRNTGGFVPVGVKERADDVPAMLSKNEFVFTADAVRNAGNGNINKGAQKMYNMMKNLENGGTLA